MTKWGHHGWRKDALSPSINRTATALRSEVAVRLLVQHTGNYRPRVWDLRSFQPAKGIRVGTISLQQDTIPCCMSVVEAMRSMTWQASTGELL